MGLRFRADDNPFCSNRIARMTGDMKPWGRFATLGLALAALLAGQMVALAALTRWYGSAAGHLPDFSGDGAAISLIVFISTPVELTLLVLFAQRRGSAAGYLGFTLPRRGDVVFGVIAVVILIVAGNVLSWLLGQAIVTSFQLDLYRTASAAGWLPWLWLAVVVVTPVGEESLFRGFLFRGWLRSPRDAWPVIVVSALLWGLLHVQYDWYVMPQLFALGILLGWLRWCSGSTLLTMLLHGLINFEGMVETYLDLKWLT
jgi:membrane protease YdiL (CAAX protease family)